MDQLNLTSINSTSGHMSSFLRDNRVFWPAALLSLCFLVGFPGNLAVIILKPNWQNLRPQTQCLMINMALTDLLCLSTLPLWIYNLVFSWTLERVTCKIIGFFTKCTIYCSLLSVTGLSVQRYMQVVHQHRCLQCKKKLLLLLWLTSMALSVPSLVIRQTKVTKEKTTCTVSFTSEVQQVAIQLTECFVGFSAFIITTCAYIFLNRKLSQAALFNNDAHSRLFSIIIVTSFVLWMPYFFFDLVIVGGILNKDAKIKNIFSIGFHITQSVTFINSCVNPLLYAFALKICHRNEAANSNNSNLTVATLP